MNICRSISELSSYTPLYGKAFNKVCDIFYAVFSLLHYIWATQLLLKNNYNSGCWWQFSSPIDWSRDGT